MDASTFTIDGRAVPFAPSQTIMQAAAAAGIYIPHLCYHPELSPHGSCRLCMVQVNGRMVAACTTQAAAGQDVLNNTQEINDNRRVLVQMLFVEGNHICPGCPKTGNCQLQAVGYYLGMLSDRFAHFYPQRPLDASHPQVMLDFNRCILCELCVRASRDMDGKHVFGVGGRGIHAHLMVNSASGKLADTNLSAEDKAVEVCPVGAIMRKRARYTTPIGARMYDRQPISLAGDANQRQTGGVRHG